MMRMFFCLWKWRLLNVRMKQKWSWLHIMSEYSPTPQADKLIKSHFYVVVACAQNCYYKKINNWYCHTMYNLIVNDLTVDNFWIRQPVPLDRDQKFVMMEGANFHPVEILALVCCSSVWDFSCSEGQKKGAPDRKNINGGNTWAVPPYLHQQAP